MTQTDANNQAPPTLPEGVESRWGGRVHLVHGIATNGDGRIAKLRPALESAGFEVVVHSYGWTWLLSMFTLRRRNQEIAADLAQRLSDGDIIVGHSNGCVIAHRAAGLCTGVDGPRQLGLIYINSALPSYARPPSSVERCHVFYAPSDGAVWWARWARKLWPLSWFRETLWGAMGRVGYRGVEDDRIEQTDLDEAIGDAVDHSGILKRRWIGWLKLMIVHHVRTWTLQRAAADEEAHA